MMVTLAMLLIGFVTTVSVDSMDTWANDIDSQVSVKKRMVFVIIVSGAYSVR